MRFTCEKNLLVTGLNITGRTVAPKSALAAIEGILCQAGKNGLLLTGYNTITNEYQITEVKLLEESLKEFVKLG